MIEVDETPGAGPGPSSSKQSLQRAKGRPFNTMREISCDRGVLHRCDGSARWTQDGTSVLAGVYGPRQAGAKKEDAERGIVEVIFKPRSGMPGHREHSLEHIIRRTIEVSILLGMHPRTSIMVILQEEQEDGSLLMCALNAACSALVNAGVPMNTMFGCATVSYTQGMNLMLVDPDASEEKAAECVISLAFPYHFKLSDKEGEAATLEVGDGVLSSLTKGCMSAEQYLDAVDVCKLGVARVAAFVRGYLEKEYPLIA